MRKLIAVLVATGLLGFSLYGSGYVGGDVNQDLTGLFQIGTNTPADIGAAASGTNTDITSLSLTGNGSFNSITITGDQAAPAWTTNGLRIMGQAGTFTDTTSSGTVAAAYTNKLGGNTIAASNSATFTKYISLYISGPTAGTNVTITNPYALGADSAIFGTSTPLIISSAGAVSGGSGYQAPITLTTTGSSGAATFTSNTLNIPQYSGGGSTPTGTGFTRNTAGVQDAASVAETGTGNVVRAGSPTLTGTPLAPTPTAGDNSTQIATTAFVQSALSTFDIKPDVAYASTSALPANTYANGTSGVGATLTGNSNGPLVIDSVTIAVGGVGSRVLVTGESASANNGWYTITQVGVVAVSPYILTRATESDQAAEIGAGYLTGVVAPNTLTPGSSNNGKIFISVAADPFTVGTTALTFSQVGSTYSAGTGITLSGTTFSLTNPVAVNLGGTGLATATAHGVLIGEGTSAFAATGAGTSGQVLQSGGASADPTYSTATYPSTAGTSGNLLTSDGTNWTSAAVTGHAVYAGASPPTVDVGPFAIQITGVDVKTAGTTAVFTVPTSRTFICTGSEIYVTAVTSGGAGTQSWAIKESSASRAMTPSTASASGTPVANQTVYAEPTTAGGGQYSVCSAGNIVNAVILTSHAGSTAVTGTIVVRGYYIQ